MFIIIIILALTVVGGLKNVDGFSGLWNENYSRLEFKTEMFTNQSNVNLDRKILFGKITHHLGPEISKMLVKGKFGDEDSTFDSGP